MAQTDSTALTNEEPSRFQRFIASKDYVSIFLLPSSGIHSEPLSFGGNFNLEGGFQINRFVYGVYHMKNFETTEQKVIFPNDFKFNLFLSGASLSYLLHDSKKVNWFANIRSGIGSAQWLYEQGSEMISAKDLIFISQPGLRIELYLLRWVRLTSMISYALTNDLNLPNTSKNTLNGISFDFGLKIGYFKSILQ